MEVAKKMNLLMFWHPPSGHNAGWRMPGAPKDAGTRFDYYVDIAQIAERAKLEALFFADSAVVSSVDLLERGDPAAAFVSRAVKIEPMTLLAALAAVTSRIGLIATGSTTYSDPFTLARRFSAIDTISGGRGGWNLVTSQVESQAQNFGFESHMAHAERYRRANEFFDVVAGLWDCWDEGAMIEDKESALVFDVRKVHVLNHQGEFFKVKGPLNEARSPQGRPIVAQAGSSGPGKDIAARVADLIFSAQTELEEAAAFRAEMLIRAAAFDRGANEIKFMPGLLPVVGRTQTEAREHYLELQSLITDDEAIRSMHRIAGGVDLTKYPLDGPLPELPVSNGAQTRQQRLIDMARKENLTLREVGRRFAEARSHNLIWGTPKSIADMMQDWFEREACDGFCVIPPYYPRGVTDFTDLVVPELQRRGIFRTEYDGPTLRENLGLPMPKSRFRRD